MAGIPRPFISRISCRMDLDPALLCTPLILTGRQGEGGGAHTMVTLGWRMVQWLWFLREIEHSIHYHQGNIDPTRMIDYLKTLENNKYLNYHRKWDNYDSDRDSDSDSDP